MLYNKKLTLGLRQIDNLLEFCKILTLHIFETTDKLRAKTE